MKRKIITTADGSKTIQIEDWNEQYHSIHGAIQEANHVYIKQGLLFFYEEFYLSGSKSKRPSEIESQSKSISILEIGFGTGLNAILTLQNSEQYNFNIDYFGIEAYPISNEELAQLNYAENLDADPELFRNLHRIPWEEKHGITKRFSLIKKQLLFSEITIKNTFDIIYYDAFGARVQPELWTEVMFSKMFLALKENGVLVTYAAKGSVKRALKAVGFQIERLQGPPGKRHMLRAIKR